MIVASGPLTSDDLAQDIARITGSEQLYFYDAISPIVDADTIDMNIAFRASRYGKSIDGSDDYINCPFNREQYEQFIDAVLGAQAYESHFDEKIPFFEACLPIEELAKRGRETLRFGPMKPVGLDDPRTGRRAVGCRATPAGKYAGAELQHRRISEPPKIWRAGAHFASDPRVRASRVSPLRTDSSQHLHQCAEAADIDTATEDSSRRSSLPGRSRELRGIWRQSQQDFLPDGTRRRCFAVNRSSHSREKQLSAP